MNTLATTRNEWKLAALKQTNIALTNESYLSGQSVYAYPASLLIFMPIRNVHLAERYDYDSRTPVMFL